MKHFNRILVSFLAGVIAFSAVYFNLLSIVDKSAEDILYHKSSGTMGQIRIIKIDDKTMNELGDISTWDRSIYTKLLNTLCVSEENSPAVVGFDILLSSEKDEKTDKEFSEVCKKYNNVVCGFSYVFSKELQEGEKGFLLENSMTVKDKVLPYKELREVVDIGFVNALMDNDDSFIRSSFLTFNETEDITTQSFSMKVYEKYMESQGLEANYPTDKSIMDFRYSGKAGDYENVSLIDVLNGTVPASAFDDCIVLVGAYAAGMMDAYFVPVDRSSQMYGVEIHANVIEAIIEGRTLENVNKIVDALISAIIIAFITFVCWNLSVVKTIIVCLGVAILKLLSGFVLFNMGYTMNVLSVPVLAVVIAIIYVAVHYYKARIAKKSIEKAFSKYVAPQVVEEIAKDGTYELKLGGENRDIAVMFVDIRGFTSLSESLEPEQVVDILNDYLELTTRCIFRHGGTLDKFVGDATMAVFNSPFDTEDYIYKAILTAWDIVKGGNKIEKEFVEKFGESVGFGVGINCGPAVVGNIGCDFRMDYTAIGDTVNTAARLEANAPRGTVYISHEVREALGDRITVEDVGEIPLKGKSNGVFVYTVTGVVGYESPEGE
ncbi:MAG: adenylate/guanylate cyclase domain-containing protein [Clostridia bacterium]|nr:adenylate/guanylate cyclase domain-containing protein [Clostridia bacterium]MBR3810258.1 adenylate/guanylate cyclase domain-containing protein [Clostridia bacterium]